MEETADVNHMANFFGHIAYINIIKIIPLQSLNKRNYQLSSKSSPVLGILCIEYILSNIVNELVLS